jgi:hypothetical protein
VSATQHIDWRGTDLSQSFTFYIGVTTVVIPRFKGIVPMLESCIKHRISIWCVLLPRRPSGSYSLLRALLTMPTHRWLVPPQVVLLCKDPGAKKYHAEIVKVRGVLYLRAAT